MEVYYYSYLVDIASFVYVHAQIATDTSSCLQELQLLTLGAHGQEGYGTCLVCLYVARVECR